MKLLLIQLLWSNLDVLIGNLKFDGQLVFYITVEEFLIAWKTYGTPTLTCWVISRERT